jgi:6-phosphogluconate dehydrogenase
MTAQSHIGIVGLGVMGSNLALNMDRNGFRVSGYERDRMRAEAFLSGPGADSRVVVHTSLPALVAALERPRHLLLMVPAGAPVDEAIALLVPLLEAGDILIDGGNSWFKDTERRSTLIEVKGLHLIGAGISGGAEGALLGPSIMPGGRREVWEIVAPMLRTIAAAADDGRPCVEYMGPGGAGHYVKMVHNGIEYGDMQLIAETYDLLHRGLGLTASEISSILAEWNKGELESFLVEMTARVLTVTDVATNRPLVDLVLDEAAQKGTGRWMSIDALEIGAPIPTINAAIESRVLSSMKRQRVEASRVLSGPASRYDGSKDRLIAAARDALHAGRIACYAQGFDQLRIASAHYGFDMPPGDVAAIWRAGCIIRARLLGDIMAAYDRSPSLQNLLVDERLAAVLARRQQSWRFVVQTGAGLGIPMPASCASLSYYDGYRSERLPANLTQALRDLFGAHTYRRVDRGGVFSSRW